LKIRFARCSNQNEKLCVTGNHSTVRQLAGGLVELTGLAPTYLRKDLSWRPNCSKAAIQVAEILFPGMADSGHKRPVVKSRKGPDQLGPLAFIRGT